MSYGHACQARVDAAGKTRSSICSNRQSVAMIQCLCEVASPKRRPFGRWTGCSSRGWCTTSKKRYGTVPVCLSCRDTPKISNPGTRRQLLEPGVPYLAGDWISRLNSWRDLRALQRTSKVRHIPPFWEVHRRPQIVCRTIHPTLPLSHCFFTVSQWHASMWVVAQTRQGPSRMRRRSP